MTGNDTVSISLESHRRNLLGLNGRASNIRLPLNRYLVIPNFFTKETADGLRARASELLETFSLEGHPMTTFSTGTGEVPLFFLRISGSKAYCLLNCRLMFSSSQMENGINNQPSYIGEEAYRG